MRIALGIEYDGKPYVGWQRQDNGLSVQQCVEEALSVVAAEPIRVVCAGRTDTGVHGACQVVHFDTTTERDPEAWVRGTNANLPKSISVLWQRSVNDEFHARFTAERRYYRYVIYNRDVRPTYLQHRVTWAYRSLDVTRMQQAANYLTGEHDFTSYRAVACQAKNPVRRIYTLEIAREQNFIFLDIEANGFLHHMVRNIAGVLMAIGSGEYEPVWAEEVLHFKDRTLGGVTAPACGLYFVAVKYPEMNNIPYKTDIKIL